MPHGMGKPKSKKSSKAHKLAKKKAVTEQTYSLDELLGKASELLDECQFELAEKFCQRALEMNADHPQALEMCANLLLERGEVEKAQHCLGRAITVQPDSGFSKYLTAGQLFTGISSRDLYLKGVELLLAAPAPDRDSGDVKSQLSSAYVALSELYMSDLCDLPEAETESARFITLALQTDPSNPETWQADAHYKLVTEHFEEAKDSMRKSLDLWLPGHAAFIETGEGQETSLSYNSRLETVKLLLDLEMLEEATKICDGLLEEDDEVVSPWYLLGWINFLKEDQDYWGNVRHYLKRARQVHVMNPTDDEDMVKHIDEILTEVGGEVEDAEAAENIDLAEDDQVNAERIADLLDKEVEDTGHEDMES